MVAPVQQKSYAEASTQTDKPELPEECYDPVSFDILTDPFITRCGHTFNGETLKSLAERANSNEIECPLCKRIVNVNHSSYQRTLSKIISIFKNKIN